MANLAQMIDESPLFQFLTKFVTEDLVGFVGKAAGAAVSGIGGAIASIGGAMEKIPGVGDFVRGGGNDGPSQGQSMALAKETPSQSIQAPAQSMDKFTISMADLGDLAPPAVGKAQAMNVGMTMQA